MDTARSQSAREASAVPPCAVTVASQTPEWTEYLRGHADAGVYHDPRWGEVMAGAYGSRPFYLTARRAGEIVGVLQLVWQKSVLFGSHLCSVPYFDAAGILADDEQARDALVTEARRLMTARGVGWVELRQLQQLDASVPARTDKVTMWLSLPSDSEAMWNQLKTKVRTKVRKSQKNDLTTGRGGVELLDDFYAAYARTMRDLGSPPHGKRFFRLILDSFPDEVRLFVVRSQGRALAGSFTLTDRQGFHVPWSGSDRRFRKLTANRLLYWSMLAYASDAGAPRFDFGRSTRDSGTYGFKKEWGAEPVPLHWHYLMPDGEALPELRPDTPKYRAMVACWRKLPLWLARAVGPRIIAKLS